MQEHDPQRAAVDRRESILERGHVTPRLRVDRSQQRLSEVGQRAAGEPSDESLRADDADGCAVDVRDRPGAFEDDDAGILEHSGDLGDLVGVVVVIPEHRVDRRVEQPAGVREDARLVGLAVQRQVACK